MSTPAMIDVEPSQLSADTNYLARRPGDHRWRWVRVFKQNARLSFVDPDTAAVLTVTDAAGLFQWKVQETPVSPGEPAKPQRAWLCSTSLTNENWDWGGYSPNEAIAAGLALYGWRNEDGFWVAPAHLATEAEMADGQEQDYTVEADAAEWIPTREPDTVESVST